MSDDTRIFDLTDLAGAQVAADRIVVVDVDDTTGNADGTTKFSTLTDWFGKIPALLNRLFTDTITAGTTQTQAGATALTSNINRVTIVGTDGDGVKLPTAVGGASITIINDDSAQSLRVFPNTDDTIDGGAADAVDAVSLQPGEAVTYAAADAVDWYTSSPGSSKGTWTPVFEGAGTAGTHAYTAQGGHFTKIGNLVTCTFQLQISSTSVASVGNAQIAGLPFASDSASTNRAALSIGTYSLFNLDSGKTQLTALVIASGTDILLQQGGDNVSNAAFNSANFQDNTAISGTLVYRSI